MFRLTLVGFILIFSALQMPAEQEQAPARELVQYVRDAKKAGLKDAQIQQNAVLAGWPAPDIKNALEYVSAASEKPAAGGRPAKPAKEDVSKAPQAAVPAQRSTDVSKPADTAPRQTDTPSPQAARPSGTAAPPVATTAPTQASKAPALQVPPAASTTPSSTPGSKPAESPGAEIPAAVSRGVPDDYRIGEGDIVQISVWGEPSASVGSVVVRPDGKITMPLIKDISVSGLTPAEAEKNITELLSNQIKAANVTVIVNQINSKKVFFVGGGVKKEGPLAYTYRMTIMQGISEAGGLTDYAKRKKIYVLRNENGRQYKLPFDYDAVLKGEHMELNLPLLPGDTIVVPNH